MNVSLDLVAAIIGSIMVLAWLFRGEGKINRAQDEIEDLKIMVNKIQDNHKEMETKVINSVEEVRKTMIDLTIQVARLMERLEHMNKRVLDLSAREIEKLVNR